MSLELRAIRVGNERAARISLSRGTYYPSADGAAGQPLNADD